MCQLLSTVGSKMIEASSLNKLDAYFQRIDRLKDNRNLETRHRFMLIDLIELKNRNWVARMEKEGPKKIEEIHSDALKEKSLQTRPAKSTGQNWNTSSASVSTSFNPRINVTRPAANDRPMSQQWMNRQQNPSSSNLNDRLMTNRMANTVHFK